MKRIFELKKEALEAISLELEFLKEDLKSAKDEGIEFELNEGITKALIEEAEFYLKEDNLHSLRLSSAILGLNIADELNLAIYKERRLKE